MGMSTKRTYGKAFAVPVQKKPFRPFPQNTAPMVLYRTPSQFKSLTNPPQGRVWPEKKNVDYPGSIASGPNGVWSEIDLVNGFAQGAGQNQRIGRKVQMKSMIFRYTMNTNAYAADQRILIVYDKQSDGILPLITDILQNDPGSGLNPTYNAPMNLNNSDRFVILADEIDHTYGGGSAVYARSGKMYRKINLPIHFGGTGNTLADISSGSIYVLCATASGGANQGIGYFSRIRYTDV